MKKLILFIAMIVAVAAFAIARDQTVEEVMQLQDGERVTLEGQLSQLSEGDLYLFVDETGDVKIDISQYVWDDLKFKPDQKYEISGEVVKDEEQGTMHVRANQIEEAKAEDQDGWERRQRSEDRRRRSEERRQEAEERRQEQEEEEDDDGLQFEIF